MNKIINGHRTQYNLKLRLIKESQQNILCKNRFSEIKRDFYKIIRYNFYLLIKTKTWN